MDHQETKVTEKGLRETEYTSFLEDCDDLEKSRILKMKRIVELEKPSSKDLDCLTLRRFLRARLDVDKASKLLLKYLRWKQTFVPNGFVYESEIPNNLSQNKMFVQGVDKRGRPIGVILKPASTSLRYPKGQEKFVCIADLEGWGYAKCDIRASSEALTLLQVPFCSWHHKLNQINALAQNVSDLSQDCYPERLGKLFIVHVPYIFMAVWKLIYSFIDDKIKKKIVFVEDKLLKKTPLDDIEESELQEIYGGKKKLVPHQDVLI